MLLDPIVNLGSAPCSVCNRAHAVPCASCGRAVCEVHQAGFRLASVLETEAPNLCRGCEREQLAEYRMQRRRSADAAQRRAEQIGPGRRGPLLDALWWAGHVWPSIHQSGNLSVVTLDVYGLDLPLETVKAQVVTGLSRAGLAGVDDRHLAPVLSALLLAADVDHDVEVDVKRGAFTSLVFKNGSRPATGTALVPLPGSLVAGRVAGAVLTPDTVLWGEFVRRGDDDFTPVGMFCERDGSGASAVGALSAVAQHLPSRLLR